MKKTILALATTAVLAVATMAPTTADARCRGCGFGIAAGLIGGAIIGGAIANSYAYPRAYYPVATGPAVRWSMRMAKWWATPVRGTSAPRTKPQQREHQV
jgi:hypothetical protein